MKQNVVIRTVQGDIDAILHGQVNVEGMNYAIIETSQGGYINGIFSKYTITPISSLVRAVENSVETVE